MKFKRIAALLAAVLLLAGVSAALGTAGSPEDPLLTKSYVDGDFVQSVLSDAKKAFAFTLGLLKAPEDDGSVKSTGAHSVKSVSAGSTAQLELGDSLTLLSGKAEVEILSGALVNVTVGGEASSGKLSVGHRYLACEDANALVFFTEASTIAVDGSVTLAGSVSPFTDVKPTDWFFTDVITAVEKGLINGKTPTTYEPNSNLKLSEAVKLAACLHQLHHTGSITLQNSSEGMWFDSYVNYALQNSILTAADLDFEAAATRQQFIEIFYRALPASSYGAINDIPDGAIPDVTGTEDYAAAVYSFYRAGILTGYSDTPGYAEHAFGADTNIARREVAAILTRMYDATARKSFTIE